MFVARLRNVALIAAASLGLTACAYDDGYGYGGVSMGWGNGYGGYGDPYYGDYGYGYGGYGGYGYPSYYGWYSGFYYPGSGYWVYDRGGHRHRWNDHQRRYWEGRRGNNQGHRENWGGYNRGDRPGAMNGDPRVQDGNVRPRGTVQQPRPPRQALRERPAVRGSEPSMRQDRGFYRPAPSERPQGSRSRRH